MDDANLEDGKFDEGVSLYDSYEISDRTKKNMARLLTAETRNRLLQKLCEAVGGRTRERICLATGIRKSDIYRYLPVSPAKKKLTPGPVITVKIIKALLQYGRCEFVVQQLESAEEEMGRSYREFRKWKQLLKNMGVVYNPLSGYQIRKIRRSQY
jgi:hypothetical protein